MQALDTLEAYFTPFRRNILGIDHHIDTPFGRKPLVYADWTAAGRAYLAIEKHLQDKILPFFANTHTETTATGIAMTNAYESAKATIKRHVNANSGDALLFCGSGMTAAVTKLQRILGLRFPTRLLDYTGPFCLPEAARPLVLVTHMEHHSNHISWLETIATVEIISPTQYGLPDLDHLESLLRKYHHRKTKIAAITACSNVTGIETPYHAIATLLHQHDGYCFVDFAASAPYVNIDMHPQNPQAALDAIYFSGHKFLGGPGTPGILLFNKQLYKDQTPDQPGGGTIRYSNPWKEHDYWPDIETREDGGTPPILQAIKAAACIRLKEQMGTANIRQRETELLETLLPRLAALPNITLLEQHNKNRLGIISFVPNPDHHDHSTPAPHDLFVQTLNDRFGIQARGGCSCAGPYGHYLLGIDKHHSHTIRQKLRSGDLNSKPGWVRLSLHPTMTDNELDYLATAVKKCAQSI